MIQSWKLGLAWLVMSGALALGGGLSPIASSTNCAYAQIIPDNTLGNENSTVTPTGSVDAIDGGATRGANLFHSFQEFNVGEGRSVYFNNRSGIENILSRVTGGNPSQILGKLGVLGNANLFLINPNGIIFGSNASLDVRGSFVGSTANGIGLTNGDIFSANPQAPLPTGLLNVNPNALLFNQIRAASIENNSVADSGLNPSSEFTATGLRVPDGNSLLLVGGDINMDGGGLFAFGGRVELGGLAGTGTVGLNGDSNNLSLRFPDSVERSNVSLSNGARVRVTAADGGSIAVNARNLEMTGRSFLLAGIERGLGSDNSKAGNIEVNATGAINLNSRSSIVNQVLPEASGQGGNVSISASTLQVEDGAVVGAATFGKGKGGNLTVDAQDIQLIGSAVNARLTGLFAQASRGSTGDAGSLTINTGELLIQNAQVNASTFGGGKGGNLTVTANKVQLVDSIANGQLPSGIGVTADRGATGDAGSLTINTGELQILNGAQVSSGTFGNGKGGDLTVNAQNVQVIGTSADGRFPSRLDASAQRNSGGDAGSLRINTGELQILNGAQVRTAAYGRGKGGNLTANAQQLLIQNGAQVIVSTFGGGKGGDLTVDAQDVQLIGESADGQFPSGLLATAEPNSTGDAGDLTIETHTLLVRDGAVVGADTSGAGKGGDLTVDAQDVQLIGTRVDGRSRSGLGASAQPNSTGDAGDLTIKTNTLLVQDRAVVTVQSFGTGTAGTMTLNVRSIRLNNNALLTANTQSDKVDSNREQATLNINSQNLIISRNSNIRTNATGENVIGGNININSDIIAAIENSDISANSANFRGGNVRINAQGIFGTQFRDVASDRTSDITATGASPEFSGTVELNTLDTDLNRSLVNLPTVPVDTQIAQTCTPGSSQSKSEFVVTGRGGLPPSPDETLSSDAIQVDWVTLNPKVENRNQGVSTNITTPEPNSIVEATGLTIAHNGDVLLTASATTALPDNFRQTPAKCGVK